MPTKLVLANSDYRNHVTDEGDQLQRGLERAGWILAGFGYGDGCNHVPTLLERYEPDIVFVQDVRDWLTTSAGCFDKRVSFVDWDVLRSFRGVKVTPLKDAGSAHTMQRDFAEQIGASAFVTYYHERSVRAAAPWSEPWPLIRTYHSVEPGGLTIYWAHDRQRACVTGAVSSVYPLRERAFQWAESLGIDRFFHPGYGNGGCRTPAYLGLLGDYKVHVATASVFGFALRKIMESVAVGTRPVTDLPEYDVLPEIDEWLVRVPNYSDEHDLKRAVDKAEQEWSLAEAMEYSGRALAFYDWREVGRRLDSALGAFLASR